MDISTISAAVGILGSLSGTIYLVFFIIDRRRMVSSSTGPGPVKSGRSEEGSTNGDGNQGTDGRPPPEIIIDPLPPLILPVDRQNVLNPAGYKQVTPPITTDGATEFIKHEAAYQDWLKVNPQGFVVNTFAKDEAKPNCTILHRAGCGSIRHYKGRVTAGAYTEREYSKVCAGDICSLERWAVRIGRRGEPFSGICKLCKPPASNRPAPLAPPHSPSPTAITTPPNADNGNAAWTSAEFSALLERCRALPPAQGNYLLNDYVENILLTVLDFQMQTPTVEKAAKHFQDTVKSQVRDFADLKNLLARFPNDQAGNTQAAQYLWGYNLWTRVCLLRRLLGFLGERGIITQEKLKEWAFQSDFQRDMAGKVKGIGFGIYKWLVMRQGVETIKPDIWVHRFLTQSIGRNLSDVETVNILEAAAKETGMKAYELDWRIWESQRNSAA